VPLLHVVIITKISSRTFIKISKQMLREEVVQLSSFILTSLNSTRISVIQVRSQYGKFLPVFRFWQPGLFRVRVIFALRASFRNVFFPVTEYI